MNPKSAGVDGVDEVAAAAAAAAASTAGDGGGGFSGTRLMFDSRVLFGLGGGTGGALNRCSLRGSMAGGTSVEGKMEEVIH